MKYDVITIGDITTDNFIKVNSAAHLRQRSDANELCFSFGDKLPYDESIEVPAVGNAANAAVSCARLGLKSAILTRVGDDFNGQLCISQLMQEGVSVDFVQKEEGKHSNYHFVLQFGAERTILIKHEEFDYQLPANLDSAWLYLTSIAKNTKEFHNNIVEYLDKHKAVKLAFQPGTFQLDFGLEFLRKIIERSELFICNKEEARHLLNKKADIKELVINLINIGAKKVVITDGKNGALASDSTRLFKVPIYPDVADPEDRTGAGDAFASTIVAFLAKGYMFKEALYYAPINSMSVTQFLGAQKGLLTHKALDAYLKDAPADYKIEEISL